MLKLPIDFKYYRLEIGINHLLQQQDQPVQLYVVRNKDTEIVEYEDLDLASIYERALGMDRNMERAVQYFEIKGENWGHLDDVDVAAEISDTADPLEGFAMPASMGGKLVN